MIAEFIRPRESILNVPEAYIVNIPSQEELDGIKEGDIILLAISTGLEDTWYTEFFCAVVTELNEGLIKAITLNNMSLSVNHGIRRDSEIKVYEDHIFAILSEEDYMDLFEKK